MALTPTARTRLAREDRKQQMLTEAHALFAARGYTAVTMDEVAAAVGVTKPLLYNYFGNKERLYLACMEPAGEALLKAVMAPVGRAGNPQEAMRSGMRAFFDFVDQDRNAWRVLFDETLPVESGIARRVGAYRTRLAELITGSLATGLPDAYRVEVEALSVAVLAAAEALARWWLRTEALSAADAAELLIETIEPGLSQRMAAAPTAAAQGAAPRAARETTPRAAELQEGGSDDQ
jgi:AcrR family transcriptional regulator